MSITVNRSSVNKLFAQLPRVADDVWQDAGVFFRQETPVARKNGGNAQRNTSATRTKITGNYPYAAVLDAGRGYRDGQMRGSTQAPKGMSQPTLDYIEKELIQRVKTLGKRS